MRASHGLVIGKFYPPHAGHALLVRAAASACERVTVVAMAASVESIPLALRVAWLREIHGADANVTVTGIADDVPVDYTDAGVWSAHVALMRQAVRGVTPLPVDAVFSSEAYGDELGRRLGARHVAIDPRRELTSVSGTGVRADPVAHWGLLAPCVRGWLARRIVIVGAESTGKTTLALVLAQRLRERAGALGETRAVPEYGREYTVDKLAAARAQAGVAGQAAPAIEQLRWSAPEFVAIARRQQQLEQQAARLGGPIVVCDTDAFATAIWHERYLGTRSADLEAMADPRAGRLYLLTHHDDVPFVQDGMRDGEAIRAAMTARFVERLDQTGRRWQWLRGGRAEREQAAFAGAERVLADGWQFAAPLG